MAAYDLWLRSASLASEFTVESMASALDCLDQALEIEPGYALAMATAAHLHAQCYLQGWVQDPELGQDRGLAPGLAGGRSCQYDANVQWMSAFAIWVLALDAQRSRELFRSSLAANPNSALALTMAGWVEAVNANPTEGRKLIERSLRLNPRHPHGWLMSAGMAPTEIADNRFDEAVSWAEKALVQNRPQSVVVLRALAVALVNAGKLDNARQVVRELLMIEPRLTVSEWRASVALAKNKYLVNTYVTALRKAGVPE